MTTFAGNILASAIYTAEPSNPDIGQQVEPDYLLAYLQSTTFEGSKQSNQPVAEIPVTRAGNTLKQFGFLDWYERIHVYPLSLDLGNIISVQQRTVVTWNAFFVERTLNDVIPLNDEGLTLTEPGGGTPLTYLPLQQWDFILQIDTDGPAVVDASYTFDFDVIDYELTVIGIRIVAWQWDANWLNPVIERFEFNTDVMAAYDGSEQRRALRGAPRSQWEFTFDIADDKRREFENIMYAWGGRVWAMPVWIDIDILESPIASGSSTIPCTTVDRDYHEDGIGVIIAPDGTYESFEVTAVNADSVDIQTPLVENYPIGSRVYPARTARLMDPRATARFHRNYARGLARFRTVEEIEREALTETLYREHPVMEREPNWREAPDIDYARKLATMDFGYGRDRVVDEAELALPVHSFRWTMLDRDEADYFRKWLYARQGRCKGIWLPTWSDDLVLVDTITTTELNIDVEACGLTYYAQGDVHRRDIRMELANGNIYYRRVSGFAIVDDNTERMTMNTTLPEQVEPADVKRISWMHYVRLDTDTIELAWSTPATAEVTLIFRGPRNEF